MNEQFKPNFIEKVNSREDLSLEEKEEIDKALSVEGVFNLHPSLFCDSKEELKAIIDAQQKILSIGSKGLAYLEKKTINKNAYEFSNFASAIAKETDLEVIEDAMAHDKVVLNHDGSAAAGLNRVASRLIFEIRKKNAADPRLDNAAEKIISVLNKDIGNACARTDYLQSLALTGTKKAIDYFKDKETLKNEYQKYIDDPNNYVEYSFQRSRFKTWEEIEKQRNSFNRQHDESEDDRDTFDGSQDDYYDRWEEDDYWERENGLDYSSEFQDDDRQEELSEKNNEKVELADKIVRSLNLREAIIPMAKFYIFNQLQKNASQENLDRSVNMIKKMSEIEEKYENIEALPTIGIEIECHEDMFGNQDVSSLKALGVRNYAEQACLREINPIYSYSALAQSRYLQEIIKAGFIRLDSRKNIPDNHRLSLHINLGIPKEVVDKKYFNEKIYILNDALNYAFTSSNRLKFRKSYNSIDIKEGESSNKMKHPDETNLNKKKKRRENGGAPNKFLRLELRASEFKDYRTYLMLEGAQRFGAMFFSSVKSRENEKMNQNEIVLAKLWKAFEREYVDVMRRYNIRILNAMDKDAYQAISLADNVNLKKECRKLIYKYSRMVGDLLEIRKKSAESVAV
jgi:hypothetical protein